MGLKVRQPGPNGEAVAVTMGTGSPWDRTKADIMPAHAGGYVTDLAVGGSFTVGASATGGLPKSFWLSMGKWTVQIKATCTKKGARIYIGDQIGSLVVTGFASSCKNGTELACKARANTSGSETSNTKVPSQNRLLPKSDAISGSNDGPSGGMSLSKSTSRAMMIGLPAAFCIAVAIAVAHRRRSARGSSSLSSQFTDHCSDDAQSVTSSELSEASEPGSEIIWERSISSSSGRGSIGTWDDGGTRERRSPKSPGHESDRRLSREASSGTLASVV